MAQLCTTFNWDLFTSFNKQKQQTKRQKHRGEVKLLISPKWNWIDFLFFSFLLYYFIFSYDFKIIMKTRERQDGYTTMSHLRVKQLKAQSLETLLNGSPDACLFWRSSLFECFELKFWPYPTNYTFNWADWKDTNQPLFIFLLSYIMLLTVDQQQHNNSLLTVGIWAPKS